MQFRKRICERNFLYQLNNQILTSTTSRLLNSFHISCKRERKERDRKYLQNEKARLKAVVTASNNSNEEYLKIKQDAEDKVKDVLC